MSLVQIFLPCLLLSSSTGYQTFKHGFQISRHVRACRHVKIGPAVTAFLLNGHSKQLAKINNSSFNTTHSARNLIGFIFGEHLIYDQISSVSRSCCYHICQLRCICPYLHSKTASTVATSTVHSKFDYCNSLYHNLPKSQITRLQQIQNSLARAVVKAPKSSHITPIFRYLHW